MALKFIKLIEATTQKMTNGGILVGDRVELVDGYKSKDSYKGLTDAVKDFIEDIFKSDLNKKVINIKTEYPSRAPGNEDNRGDSFVATVAVELTNGLYDNQNAVAIPLDLLKADTAGHDNDFGKAPVPDSVKYDNKVKIKPEEVDEEDEIEITRKTQQDFDGNLKSTEVYLAKGNTKIPSAPATPSQSVGNTSQYMS